MIGLTLNSPCYNTRRCLDVDSTLFERYGLQIDNKTTLCACWDVISKQLISDCVHPETTNRLLKIPFFYFQFYHHFAKDLSLQDTRWITRRAMVEIIILSSCISESDISNWKHLWTSLNHAHYILQRIPILIFTYSISYILHNDYISTYYMLHNTYSWVRRKRCGVEN